MSARATSYSSYPAGSVALYNATTVLHYLVGGAGIIVGYRSSPLAAWVAGVTYVLLALAQMYLLTPLVVCPACFYHRLEGSRCVSGLSAVSRLLAHERPEESFGRRGAGVFCPNKIRVGAMLLPVVAMIRPLVISPSTTLAILFATLLLVLVFRIFVLIPKIACLHCLTKHMCPQAEMLGVRER